MTCCGTGWGWFDQWCYLIGAALVLIVSWVAYRAIRDRLCGIRCVTNFICADCGESVKENSKFCPECGKPVNQRL